MKQIAIVIMQVSVFVILGCSRSQDTPLVDHRVIDSDSESVERFIGHWAVDVPQTIPRQRAMLEQRGFTSGELKDRMEKLTALHSETKMQITSNTIAITERGQRREILYEHFGGGRLLFWIGTNYVPVVAEFNHDGALHFDIDMTGLSYIIWRKKNHNN